MFPKNLYVVDCHCVVYVFHVTQLSQCHGTNTFARRVKAINLMDMGKWRHDQLRGMLFKEVVLALVLKPPMHHPYPSAAGWCNYKCFIHDHD